MNDINERDMEKYSSAVTLSDMEIFVFPELMYSLVLANLMSPVLWRWREEETFKKLRGKTPYRKLMRLKQFIMDEVDFNLDLETWGLTHQEVELKRFAPYIEPEQIAASNALFGYHGDQYYFDVDIRRHFGLDKYHSDVIPYWKTETIEAMHAFRHKEHYQKAAGECVSLAALYAAAAFIVCGIPLEDIFMILTPLHSQNFLDLQEGIITNNRRLVTKTMWFNGTEISDKAQRALRNERVTIVAHCSGHIHCLYEQATIDPEAYHRFRERLQQYLTGELNLAMVANFLRSNHHYQRYFQVCRHCHGQPQFLKAETLFHYEHGSNYRVADETFDKLLSEVSDEDYYPYEMPDRIRCDQLHTYLSKTKPDLNNPKDRERFEKLIAPYIPDTTEFVSQLADFVTCPARLPSDDKEFITTDPVRLTNRMNRQEVIATLTALRDRNPVVDLAFYAYRDMEGCDWRPFIKAAVERNPVALETSRDMTVEQVYTWLLGMQDCSIYEGTRLAQPDEVVNFKTGDGLEKALVLANVIRSLHPEQMVKLAVEPTCVRVLFDREFSFRTCKGLSRLITIQADGRIVVSQTTP